MNYHQALNKIHSQLYMEQLLLKPLSVGRHMFVSGKQDPSRKGIVLALRKQKPCVVTELFKANRRLTHIAIRLTSTVCTARSVRACLTHDQMQLLHSASCCTEHDDSFHYL